MVGSSHNDIKQTRIEHMSKIDKNANLYDKDGKLLRKAPLKDVTIEELEKLIDEYEGDKNSAEYANLIYSLTDLYRKYGNPHEQDLLNSIKAMQDKKEKENVIKSLNELNEQLGNNNEDDSRGVLSSDENMANEDIEDETAESNNIPSYDVDSNASEYVEPITE